MPFFLTIARVRAGGKRLTPLPAQLTLSCRRMQSVQGQANTLGKTRSGTKTVWSGSVAPPTAVFSRPRAHCGGFHWLFCGDQLSRATRMPSSPGSSAAMYHCPRLWMIPGAATASVPNRNRSCPTPKFNGLGEESLIGPDLQRRHAAGKFPTLRIMRSPVSKMKSPCQDRWVESAAPGGIMTDEVRRRGCETRDPGLGKKILET